MLSTIIRTPSKMRVLPIRRFSSQKSPSSPTASTTKKTDKDVQINTNNIPGLSSYVIKQKAEPLGPGASTDGAYKVPEYFCYDRFSYHGAEVRTKSIISE